MSRLGNAIKIIDDIAENEEISTVAIECLDEESEEFQKLYRIEKRLQEANQLLHEYRRRIGVPGWRRK